MRRLFLAIVLLAFGANECKAQLAEFKYNTVHEYYDDYRDYYDASIYIGIDHTNNTLVFYINDTIHPDNLDDASIIKNVTIYYDEEDNMVVEWWDKGYKNDVDGKGYNELTINKYFTSYYAYEYEATYANQQ